LGWHSSANKSRFGGAANIRALNESEIDDALQQAATNALGQREGAIIVMDPRTGRLRAVINPRIAFEHAYPIGSTIKPFTALASLRAGLIDKNSRTLCRGEYARPGFAIACTHPKDLPAFDTAEALAYSCNYYFGTLGERLSEERLNDTLTSFGFGKLTGINADDEAAGQLLRGKPDARNPLGEGEYLQATPIQLITAYAALVNGGHLFTPRSAGVNDSEPQTHSNLLINADQRGVIVTGMRGAVVSGTAAPAGLAALPLNIFGKTGTSTQLKGSRTHGWFVGFASAPEQQVEPESAELAVLVFLYKGHGAQAAKVARPVFAAYAGARQGDGVMGRRSDGTPERNGDAEPRGHRDTATRRHGDVETQTTDRTLRVSIGSAALMSPRHRVPVSPRPSSPHPPISPSPHRPVSISALTLEDYILGVVAAEGSTEDQPEALKALAIAARTFAMKNLGRHADDGYDFCTSTHCQRFIDQTNARTRASIVAAVRETSGMVLHDQDGQLVESYFSASCGGATANIENLWGVKGPTYLRGVQDGYCTLAPHHSWTDTIAAAQMLKALRSDPRTDPGAHVTDVLVTRHDVTGRAESIAIEGEHRRTIRGWDFKIIVGRALGWNLLKSSRFEIARSGSGFVFRGSGFGHGLGLCQEGAHVMAQRGAGYGLILAKYFPGTRVGKLRDGKVGRMREGEMGELGDRGIQSIPVSATISALRYWQADILPSPAPPIAPSPHPRVPSVPRTSRLSLSSEHFRISYPTRIEQRDAEHILATLESTRADLMRHVAAAAIATPFPTLEIFINDTTGDFVARTGQPWWAAAATRGNRIELQPLDVLKRRGVLETTLRHELAHPLIDQLSHGHAPRWLAEGLALYLAGEGPAISRFAPSSGMTLTQIDQQLAQPRTMEEARAAYASAHREVQLLIKVRGETSVWRMVAGISAGGTKL
jgi:SpoIID/LytB domain protein